jgi:hypothetical protein
VGAGYNGHARKCECGDCVKRRVNDYLARIEDTSRMVPSSTYHSVPVRAHWRKQPKHLKKQPKFKAALGHQLSLLMRRGGS